LPWCSRILQFVHPWGRERTVVDFLLAWFAIMSEM
jgi:hypothetical protein